MKTGKYFNCQTCNKEFYRAPWQIVRSGEEKQKFCSLSCRRHTDEGCKNMALKKIGKPSWSKGLSKLTDSRLDYNRPTTFKNQGKSTKAMLFRKSIEYKLWRTKVFERDNYTCQVCNIKGGKLNADHIKPFCLFPELRLDVNNGRTLCETCHRLTPTFGRKALNYYGTISQNF